MIEMSKERSHAGGVSCWQSIMSSLGHFCSLVHFKVKIGLKNLFRHDMWRFDKPLKV